MLERLLQTQHHQPPFSSRPSTHGSTLVNRWHQAAPSASFEAQGFCSVDGIWSHACCFLWTRKQILRRRWHYRGLCFLLATAVKDQTTCSPSQTSQTATPTSTKIDCHEPAERCRLTSMDMSCVPSRGQWPQDGR